MVSLPKASKISAGRCITKYRIIFVSKMYECCRLKIMLSKGAFPEKYTMVLFPL